MTNACTTPLGRTEIVRLVLFGSEVNPSPLETVERRHVRIASKQIAKQIGNSRMVARRLFALCTTAMLLSGCGQGVLDPRGPIGDAERTILFNSLGIMLAIVIPTIVATLGAAWWFRASNSRARYRPNWTFSGQLELVVWAVPAMVVLLLGGIAWIGSHDLDPAKPIASPVPAVKVQVVSLDWKWLFIYPELGVASVNRLTAPAGVPLSFELTSSGVMNSFFVPQLGSQIYTMAGMATRLNLMADAPGNYRGISAQFSGAGFSDMRFVVNSVAQEEFKAWVEATKVGAPILDRSAYEALRKPSSAVPPAVYRNVDAGLFDEIVAMRPRDGAPATGTGHRGH